MNKRDLTETDIRTKFITPALRRAGWDEVSQLREEVNFTDGRITVRGRLVSRGKRKRADYILDVKPNIPIAVIEAKDNKHGVGAGMQQALAYAETLNIPFAFSSNGDGFVFHDRTGTSTPPETNLPLDAFPSPADLWARYRAWKGLTPEAEEIVLQDYFEDGGGKTPRYYQINAVNAAVEAIAKGQDRILLVMATGTGKTYTAFQIVWRLWKARRRKRILFLADRNVLIDQTIANDFRPFGGAMTKLSRDIDTSYEVYLGLYQAITGPEEKQKAYRQLSPGFFDLIVIDECHRGSAADDSAWREILEYFSSATQIGLTATPKETKYVSNIDYFGAPVFSYSLKQGIRDGFLAPYKVVKVHIDRDIEGYRPEKGQLDRDGEEVEDRVYNVTDFDRTLVIDGRTKLVAEKVTTFLRESGDRFQKAIVFCVDQEHAARMRQALVNENADLVDGRGTRVHEDTEKFYFTLIDFRNASGHFADPDFDGDPVQIYEPGVGDPILPPDTTDDEGLGEEEMAVIEGGNGLSPSETEPTKKIYVDGIDATIVAERVEYLDEHGKLITESLRDFTRKALRRRFASLDDFLNRWNAAERKQAILDEMAGEGLPMTVIGGELDKDLDPFDLVCHIAFDAKPLTRRERVENVRKRDVFTRYGGQARAVLGALLDKYADEGVINLDDANVLRIPPLDSLGTPVELVRAFGGKPGFERAVRDLQSALYKEVA